MMGFITRPYVPSKSMVQKRFGPHKEPYQLNSTEVTNWTSQLPTESIPLSSRLETG